jgi:hypothetical protein
MVDSKQVTYYLPGSKQLQARLKPDELEMLANIKKCLAQKNDSDTIRKCMFIVNSMLTDGWDISFGVRLVDDQPVQEVRLAPPEAKLELPF